MFSSNGKVIVAVDDNVDNLDLLKRIVTGVGYGFHGCTDSRKFLPLLKLAKPDLILLDVEMPELDGFELCRTIRQQPETKRTPVLFVTGRNSRADIQQALAVGGNDFVVKPFMPTKLRERIDLWIRRAAWIEPESLAKAVPGKRMPTVV